MSGLLKEDKRSVTAAVTVGDTLAGSFIGGRSGTPPEDGDERVEGSESKSATLGCINGRHS